MKKLILILGIMFLISSLVIAIDFLKESPICQDGMCLTEKVDLNVNEEGNTITINDLIISDTSSSYVINELRDTKKISEYQYVQTLNKDSKTKDVATTYSEEPNMVQEQYHFTFYEDYQEYCKEFKDCLSFEDYTYNILYYDNYKINTKRIDQTTGEIYPTEYVDGHLKTKIPNTKTSVSFNDIVQSSGVITINGNDIEWINFTRFLVDVAPQCWEGNGSGITEENMSAVILSCGLTLNHSANISWEDASLYFDLDVTGINPFLVGNKTIMNLTGFNLGSTGNAGVDNPSVMLALAGEEMAGCTSGEPGYSPNCGVMNWDQVNVNNFGGVDTSIASYQIMNGSFKDVKFVRAQPAYAAKVANVVFDTMHILDATILGGKFEGTGMKLDSGDFPYCFTVIFSKVEMDLTGGTFICPSFGSTVGGIAKININITDVDSMESTNIVRTFNGEWDFYLKKTIDMQFRGDNCHDNVTVNTTMVDSQGTTYRDLSSNFNQVLDVFSSTTGIPAVETDFNPFTFNLTNSSYFPVTDFACNFTETDQSGVWHMYEIPVVNGYKYTRSSNKIYDLESNKIF